MYRLVFSLRPLVASARSFALFTDLMVPKDGSPIEKPPLTFDIEQGCAPVFSKRQLELHYGKHHQDYVDKLNSLISQWSPTLTDEFGARTAINGVPIEDLYFLSRLDRV